MKQYGNKIAFIIIIIFAVPYLSLAQNEIIPWIPLSPDAP